MPESPGANKRASDKAMVTHIVKYGLLRGLVACCFLFAGCGLFPAEIEPTYKEKDIPHFIKTICKDEYGIEVIVKQAAHTLWVYAPQDRILHEDFGKKKDKIFDEAMIDKARNILTSISRVLISADKAPDFFVLVLSDIKRGIDYSITAKVEDIKKIVVGALPFTEASRRYVFILEENKRAKADTTGAHLMIYDVTLPGFLARQMAQRIRQRIQEDDLKGHYVLKEITAVFRNKDFIVQYTLVKNSEPPRKIYLNQEIAAIIAYCIQTYAFQDFSSVMIKEMLSGESNRYTKRDIFLKAVK